MAERLKNLRNLFEYELRDLYSCESQIIDFFQKVIDKVGSNELKSELQNHLDESRTQKTRIENICKELDIEPTGVTSRGVEGLIREVNELMNMEAESEVMDAGLIAGIQKVEHYEIAGYGTVRTYAELLDMSDIRSRLEESLNEEKKSDAKLTEIAKTINSKAVA